MFNIRNYLRNPSIPRIAGIVLFIALALLGCDDGDDDSSPPEIVSDLALDALVKKPVLGGTPITTPIDAAQYTGTIAWTNEDEEPFTAAFAAKTVYIAVVKLKAKTGYTFTGVKLNSFTYSGVEKDNILNFANSGDVTITFPELTAETVIPAAALKLDTLVKAPAVGGPPVTTAINATWDTGTIAWRTSDDKALTAPATFVAGTVYKAVVALTARTGYTFTGVKENSFTYTGATVTNPANSGVVTITFQDNVVDDLALDAFITAPAKDATPATTIKTAAEQYTGTIAWSPKDEKFVEGTVYTAVVTLTAKPGFTFTGVKKDSFSYGDDPDKIKVTNELDSGEVTIAFPELATEGDTTPVNGDALKLDVLVPTPAKGATPTTAIDAAQYTGIIEWNPDDEKFVADTVYKAEVTLKAKTGFTFTGVKANSFTYTDATVTNAANSGIVTITFPAVKSAPVTELALDDFVIRPVKSAEPDPEFKTTTTSPTQYTGGTITWTPNPATFVEGIEYKAEVTLTAVPGYTFEDLAENSFTYAGAKVSKAAGKATVRVTITFPKVGTEIPVKTPLALDDWVDPPVRGESPGTKGIDETQYTGTIAWKRAGSGVMTGTFEPSTVYIAVVSLTAKANYTFIGVDKSDFTYSGMVTVERTANTGEITITFPPTAALGDDTLINTSLVLDRVMTKAKVLPPVKGEKPVTVTTQVSEPITKPRYTARITWGTGEGNSFTSLFEGKDSEKFAADTVYTARVTLTANEGYTFDGLAENSFSYNAVPGVKVTNGDSDGRVYITFPATAP
jgi:hypothetical protein